MAERAVREGWPWARLAEELLWLRPELDPVGLPARLEGAARERASLGSAGATRAAIEAVVGK